MKKLTTAINDMAVNHYFNHYDSTGRDPFVRMCDFGYCFNAWKGEVIAAGQTTPQQVLNDWIGSPNHEPTLRDSHYIVVGIAHVFLAGSDYGTYWAINFGSIDPNAPAPTPTPTPTVRPPTRTPTPSPTLVPTRTPTPRPTATLSPSPTRTSTPHPTPRPCWFFPRWRCR